jgi:ribosome-associated translation inhibitor RaiA
LPLNDDNKTVIQLSKELEQIIRKNKTQASLYPEEKIAIENAIKALSTQIERQKTEFKQLENLKQH